MTKQEILDAVSYINQSTWRNGKLSEAVERLHALENHLRADVSAERSRPAGDLIELIRKQIRWARRRIRARDRESDSHGIESWRGYIQGLEWTLSEAERLAAAGKMLTR